MPEANAEGPEPGAAEAPEAVEPDRAATPAPPVTLAPAGDERVATPETLDADGERPILRRSEKPEES
jgi:hypothetical protein